MKQLAFVLTFILAFSSTNLFAQPSDAQVRADINNPGIISMKLSKTGGSKVWSSADLQYYWERGVVLTRNAKIAEYPNATVEIGGLARYSIVGGKFVYKRFLVTWNEYRGIPTPSDDDILQLVNNNLSSFVGSGNYNQIVSQIKDLTIAEERKSEWHTPNSFSINLSCSYDRVVSYTEVASFDAIYRVRFYRDDIQSEWKSQFVSTREKEEELSKRKYTAEEIRVMPSLGSMDAENKAQAALDNLPNVTIPAFEKDTDVFMFVHKMLLEGSEKEFHAMMMKMMAPSYFVEGSNILLTQNGADLINRNMERAYQGKSTYAEQYCADPAIKHRQTNMIQLLNKSKQVYTRIAIGKFGGRFERGVRVDQEYKITDLSVGVLRKQVDFDYMNSFPEEELCPSTTEVNEPEPVVASTQSTHAATTIPNTNDLVNPGPVFQTFQSAAGYQVDLPGQAQETTASATGGTQYTATAKTPQGVFQISVLPLPKKYNEQQKIQVIDGIAESFRKANQATKRSEKPWTFDGNPGKVYDMVRPQSGVVKYRVFASDSHLYQLILSTTQKAYTKESETKFFESFKLN